MRIASCNVTGARGCRWSGCELRRLGWSKRWVLVTSGGGTGGGGGIGGGISCYLRGQRLSSTVFPTPGSPTTTHLTCLHHSVAPSCACPGCILLFVDERGWGESRSADQPQWCSVEEQEGSGKRVGAMPIVLRWMLTMDRAAKGRVGRTVKSERGAGFKGVCACVGGCVCGGGAGAYMLS